MAITFNDQGQLLTIPGAYAAYTVQNSSSNIATTGVIMLVGESSKGPDFTREEELQANAFGPSQQADVLAKYGSGRICDAFSGMITALNDPNIQGSFNSCIIVKTNPSAKAQANLLNTVAGTYAVLADQSYGKGGNGLFFNVTANTSEVKPTTGAFAFLPPVSSLNMNIRVNGGTEEPLSLSALELPPAFVSALNGLAGVSATGGADRGVIGSVTGSLAVLATGNNVVITYTTSWTVTPTVGDTLYIPTGSAIAGAGNVNVGSYIVTAATANTISATKLANATGSATPVNAPANVSSTPVVSTTADLRCFAPIVITTLGSTVVDGLGKSLEINELTTGVDLLSNYAWVLTTSLVAAKVSWLSKASSPKLLTSDSEYSASLNVTDQASNVTEHLIGGGAIALAIGYKGAGATASVVITDTTLVTTVTNGSGASLSLNLADYPTMSALATFLNSQPGYTASVVDPSQGLSSPVNLDNGTFTFGSTFGTNTARLKGDANAFYQAVTTNSVFVQLNIPPSAAMAGLPAVTSGNTFLSGGTLAGTSNAIVAAALLALQDVTGNFAVSCFSQDASLDIPAAATDSTSTYTIDSVNAAFKNHVLAMSTLKARRRRQAFLSYRGTFTADKAAAYNLATARCSMSFQDMKDLNSAGSIVQFQPFYSAAKAAGAQAALDYRAMVQKQINCSGLLQAAGDFKDNDDGQITAALNAGLLPMQRNQSGGGFIWVSDQTTYSADDNFVFNSIQAIYAADVIASTLEIRLQKAFVGQSIADVSAAQALSSIANIMSDLFRLKRIASSSDAPAGYKNTVVNIQGPVMKVSLEVKLAGTIYFVPIQFVVSQVTQTATQQ